MIPLPFTPDTSDSLDVGAPQEEGAPPEGSQGARLVISLVSGGFWWTVSYFFPPFVRLCL